MGILKIVPKFVRTKKFVALLSVFLGILMIVALTQPFMSFNVKTAKKTPTGEANFGFEGQLALNLKYGNKTVGQSTTVHLAWISDGQNVVDGFNFDLAYKITQTDTYGNLEPISISVGITLQLIDGGHGQEDINENVNFKKTWTQSLTKDDIGVEKVLSTTKINFDDIYKAGYGSQKPVEGEEYWWRFQITIFANITLNTGDKALPYAKGTFELKTVYKSDFTDCYSVEISSGGTTESGDSSSSSSTSGGGGSGGGSDDNLIHFNFDPSKSLLNSIYPLVTVSGRRTGNDYLLPVILIFVGIFLYWRERKK